MYLILYSLYLFISYTFAEQPYVILDEFRSCETKQDILLINMSRAHLHLAPDGLRQFVDTDVQLLKDIPNHSAMEIRIERCKSKESPDTCMKFTSLKTTKYCDIMGSDHHGFKKYLDCFKPRVRCPLKKNVYRARNCYLDFSKFGVIPITGVYWKITGQVYSGTKTIGCGYASGIVIKK